jgi:hypothetical protein
MESDLGDKTTWRLKTLGLSDIAEANLKLQDTNHELMQLEIRWRAGELALAGIERLSGDVDLSLRQALAPGDYTASHYFEYFTRGRYTSVSAAGEDGSVVVQSRDGNRLPAYGLSRGTRDQLFLALRLAIIRRIIGSPGFMIWDDSFLTADHERKRSLVKAAVELAGSGWQILYLTVDRDTRDLFKEHSRAQVIELLEPS